MCSSAASVRDQQVVSFATQGVCNTLEQAVQSVAHNLSSHLAILHGRGKNPIVVSVSHNSGYTDVTRYHASIVAVISTD